jgi:hypothetical protein
MDQAVGFDELRWLQELTLKTPKQAVPALIEAKLLKRGLVEHRNNVLALTARGRIAIAKLG